MSTNPGATGRTILLLAAAALLAGASSPADAQVTLQRSGTPIYTRTLPIAAPAGVTVTAGKGGIVVGWQAVSTAASYEVQRAPDATSAAATVGTAPASAVSFLDPTMSARGPAWYQVVTVAADGRRAASTRVQLVASAPLAIDKTTVLGSRLASFPVGAPPTGLRAETSPTRIGIRWSCPSGATGFDVYVTPQGGAEAKLTATPVLPPCVQDVQLNQTIVPGAPAPTSTAPSYSLGYTHSGVTPGSTYTYVVRALYPNGAVAASTAITAKADPALPPAGFVASASGRSATLQWQSVSGATFYRVFRKSPGQTAFQELVTGQSSATTYNDQTILAPGQHQYYVQAANGLPSPAATVTIPPWPAPASLIVTATSTMVTLQWSMVLLSNLPGFGPRGPSGYLVFRQRQGESGYTQLTASPVPALSDQDTGVPVGQRASYYVKGVDGEATAPVSVVPGGPINVTATPYRGTSDVDFRWDGTSDAIVVRVLRAGTPSGPFTDVTQSGSLKNWARTVGNPVGVVQYFKVSAIYANGAAESAPLPVTIGNPPQGITNLRATSPSPGTASLTWTCDPEAVGYQLLRGKGTEPMAFITSSSGQLLTLEQYQCSYTDTGLWNGATYRYTVAAKYADPNTSMTAGVSVTIAP